MLRILLPYVMGNVTGSYRDKFSGVYNVSVCQNFCLSSSSLTSQPRFICSKLTIETLEQGVKYVQS